MQSITKEQKEAIEAINAINRNFTVEFLMLLVHLTNIKGCSFISIKGYQSAKSNGTETAHHLVNIGAAYENMLPKTLRSYSEVGKTEFIRNILTHNFSGYQRNDKAFKKEIIASFEQAKHELCNPKKSTNVDNNIYLNSILRYNTNTGNLNIFGQSVKKEVEVKGTFKVVNSSALTVAKNIFRQAVKDETGKVAAKDMIRTFSVDRLNCMKVRGNEILIGEHEEEMI